MAPHKTTDLILHLHAYTPFIGDSGGILVQNQINCLSPDARITSISKYCVTRCYIRFIIGQAQQSRDKTSALVSRRLWVRILLKLPVEFFSWTLGKHRVYSKKLCIFGYLRGPDTRNWKYNNFVKTHKYYKIKKITSINYNIKNKKIKLVQVKQSNKCLVLYSHKDNSFLDKELNSTHVTKHHIHGDKQKDAYPEINQFQSANS